MSRMLQVPNRRCIRKLSFRTFQASRKRNVIAVIAICLTTVLFTTLFTVLLSMNAAYEEYQFRQVGGYSHGAFKKVTEEQMEAIAGHELVKACGERKVIGIVWEGAFARERAEVSFMDENCSRWSYAWPTTGRLPEQEDEITMDTGALALLGIEPRLGAQIPVTFQIMDKDQTGPELSHTFTLVGFWTYDDMLPVHYMNVSREYAAEVEQAAVAQGMEPFRTDLSVMMKSSVNIRGQMEQVRTDLGYGDEAEYEAKDGNMSQSVDIGVNWGYTSEQFLQELDIGTVLALVCFLALVVFTGYLIIYNIFQISVSGDIRFYGLLKTIGVTPKQLGRMMRYQALFLCLPGIPAGLLLGYLSGCLLLPTILATTSLGGRTPVHSASIWIFVLSALFSMVTVLLSCEEPGRMAAKVSPVEAVRYTENHGTETGKLRRFRHKHAYTQSERTALADNVTKNKKHLIWHLTGENGQSAKIQQMAFANLGRNRKKTVLAVISMALAVVLLNVLVLFVTGMDRETYLSHMICGDFIVSTTDYFQYRQADGGYISEDSVRGIRENTEAVLSGCGYENNSVANCFMSTEAWRQLNAPLYDYNMQSLDSVYETLPKRGETVQSYIQLEGFDPELFEKLDVIEGDLEPLYDGDSHAIALAVMVDDYDNPENQEYYPAVGEELTVVYAKELEWIDRRTGEPADRTTPAEEIETRFVGEHEVQYTVCALVRRPHSIGYRYYISGTYDGILPVEVLERDSGRKATPLFYLFDAPDQEAEARAEHYLAQLTEKQANLMYESKQTARKDFERFRQMFSLVGGALCAIIGLEGIFNFFNAMMTSILTRRREFALLGAVGMSRGQLRRMLVYEGIFYALFAVAAAAVCALFGNPLLRKLLQAMFWFFKPHATIWPVLAACSVFLLLGVLIPELLYGQAAKKSIVEILRETE